MIKCYYLSKYVCPRPQRRDLGLVFLARSAVELLIDETLTLVNEQADDHNWIVGVPNFLMSQPFVSICDFGFLEELFPCLHDVSLGIQNGLLSAYFAHRLLDLD